MTDICPVLDELYRDMHRTIPEHDARPDATMIRCYLVADWAIRIVAPKFLRKQFPAQAASLEAIQPIENVFVVDHAAKVIRKMLDVVSPVDDGLLNPPIKQAYWCGMGAEAVAKGHAAASAFGVAGLVDLGASHGIDLQGDFEEMVDELCRVKA